MRLNTNKISELVEESKFSKLQICRGCDFTGPTLARLMSDKDVKLNTLISFATFFKRPISYFFDEEPQNVIGHNSQLNTHGAHNNYNNCSASDIELQTKVSFLEKLLAEKDTLITELRADKKLLQKLLSQR